MPPIDPREETLFTAALERSSSERAAFLDRACLGDDALRQRLEEWKAKLEVIASPAPEMKP